MAHSYTVEKFLKVPTEWHPPRRDAEGNWIDPRDDLLPGCAIQCTNWMNEYNACAARIAQRNDDKGNCQAQYEEFAMCQDHCVTHHVFHHLRSLAGYVQYGLVEPTRVTNHFIRATKRGNALQVNRIGKRAWAIIAPLPGDVSGSLSKFDATFGYPIDFACSCNTLSTESCSCSHDSVFSFWNSLCEFISDYADSTGQATSIESVRRRFVQFYIDLPVWNHSSGHRRQSPESYRQALIADANALYYASVPQGDHPSWIEWPETHQDLTEDDTAELFSSDVSVLSFIRSVVDRNFSTLLGRSKPIDHILSRHGPIVVLQIASVLDQLNLVELSGDVLEYFSRHEQSFVNDVPFWFIKRVNETMSRRNVMKGKFFNPQLTRSVAPPESALARFREKLGRMLLNKRLSNDSKLTEKENKKPGMSSPVESYWNARRSGYVSSVRVPVLPFETNKLSEKVTGSVQTHSESETSKKNVRTYATSMTVSETERTESSVGTRIVASVDSVIATDQVAVVDSATVTQPVEVSDSGVTTYPIPVEAALVGTREEPLVEAAIVTESINNVDVSCGHQQIYKQDSSVGTLAEHKHSSVGTIHDQFKDSSVGTLQEQVKDSSVGTQRENNETSVGPLREEEEEPADSAEGSAPSHVSAKTTKGRKQPRKSIVVTRSRDSSGPSTPPVAAAETEEPSRGPRRRIKLHKNSFVTPLRVAHTYVHVPRADLPAPSSARWTASTDSPIDEWDRTAQVELDKIINE